MLYPDPEKGGRGKRSQIRERFGDPTKPAKTFQNRLSEARAVLRYSADLAIAVRDSKLSLR